VRASLCKPKADRGTRSLSNGAGAMQLRFFQNKKNVLFRGRPATEGPRNRGGDHPMQL